MCWTTCAPPPRRRRSTRSGPGWPGSCSAANGPGSWPGHCPGERFRATAATLLLAQPPPQLLLLDEPTNNLDLASAWQLAQALDGYRGALIVASHDLPFLRSIGVTRWLQLDRGTGLAEGQDWPAQDWAG